MARAGVKPRAPRPSKLDPYIENIDTLLDDYPDITAQRVFEEIKLLGYDGGYTIVKEYVRRARPKPAKRAFDPVVLPPGKQGQVDWSPYTLDSGEEIEAFSAILPYSRHQHVDFSANRQQHTLFRHLVHSFDEFEGVPHELVFDSEKTVVDRWEMGKPVLNLGMVDFAAYYRFAVHIAPRADGPYKGRVERPFWFLETNFFNGRTFNSLEEARATLGWWLENRGNCRKHRTTRRQPVEMLQEEIPHLIELPRHPYDTSEICWRIADGFHRVEFETNTYTVPRAYVGFRLCVRATENVVHIHDGYARHLATHERAPRGAHAECELPEHRRQRRIDIDKVMERIETWGEAAACFAARLRQQQRYVGVELSSIIAMQAEYRLEDILDAQVRARRERAIERRIKNARFPKRKSLDNFDFEFQSGVDRDQIMHLATLDWLERRQSILFGGMSGTGKSHIAIALGHLACVHGYTVRYTTSANMLSELHLALATYDLQHAIKPFTRCALLVIDEVGLDRPERQACIADDAGLFYKVVSARYEDGLSTVITTNIPWDQWGDYLGDDIATASILDRLVHHSRAINIDGPSWRAHQHQLLNRSSNDDNKVGD